ncbi:heme-dependent peroxidase [Halobacteriales archaeon QS_3_64_16]|nr:MAG: heme-dependent peroxidase [Halobacteriales archaeon QS_3_64_16]
MEQEGTERRKPPETEEGWYALHDFRTIDWDAWREAPPTVRERAIEEGSEYLANHEALADTDRDRGASAVFSVLGHEADFMILHLRPEMADVELAERRFERTSFAEFTDHTDSFVSVTEASGYTTDLDDEEMDPGLRRYIDMRLRPTLPDAEYVCFYPMDKRRGESENWYDLPFEERAEHMSAHGDIGRKYAGKVTQIVTGSVGFDDWEWGVTLFSNDPTEIKHLLYEMRFDPSTSRYAEFGSFYFGRRFEPSDLGAFLAGDPVPSGGTDTEDTPESDAGSDEGTARPLRSELDALDVPESLEIPEGACGVLVDSDADRETIAAELDGLRGNFEHYDSHLGTVLASGSDDDGTGEDDETITIASLWETERAADTAAGFLADLPGVLDHRMGPIDTDGTDARDASNEEPAATTPVDPQPPADTETGDIRGELADLDIYAGQPHGEDVYALVLYSEADSEGLAEQVTDLQEGFERYDTHTKTAVYENPDGERSAVVSLWETERAADTAAGFLADLPGIVARAGKRGSEGVDDSGRHAEEESGFGTMGMFYTTKPEHREEFVERFESVGDLLADMEGHGETDLLVNREAENDMFIASQWRSREDAMDFFRSDAFRETVSWGREVLADRPRHVFLA